MRLALPVGAISLVAVAVAGCFGNGGADSKPLTVRVEARTRGYPHIQRVGPWDIGRNIARAKTFRAAIRAFGRPDRCRLVLGMKEWSRAEWRSLGASAIFTTLGGFAEGEDACSAPASVYVYDVRLTGTRWRTSRGLQVGDSASRLRALYPRAKYFKEYRRPEFARAGGSYWALLRTTEACLGICETPFVQVTRLVAEMEGGRVAAFIVPVGAQGE